MFNYVINCCPQVFRLFLFESIFNFSTSVVASWIRLFLLLYNLINLAFSQASLSKLCFIKLWVLFCIFNFAPMLSKIEFPYDILAVATLIPYHARLDGNTISGGVMTSQRLALWTVISRHPLLVFIKLKIGDKVIGINIGFLCGDAGRSVGGFLLPFPYK